MVIDFTPSTKESEEARILKLKEDAVEAVYLWDDKEGTVRNGRSYGQEEWE